MNWRLLVLGSMALLATWLPSRAAWAVPPRAGTGTTSESGAWHALFDQGRAAYDAERYEDAAEAFFRAREAGGPPSLLYNQALCLDRLERTEAAASVYRQYLDASPTAANRAEVEARLRELEGTTGSSGRLATRVAPTPPVMQMMPLEGGFEAVVVGQGRPVVRTDEGPRVEEVGPEWVVSWFLLVGTLASTGAAIGVWVDGQATFDQLRSDCAARMGCSEDEIASSSAHTSETVTNVLVVASALLGTATAISFLAEGFSTGGTRVYVDLGPGSLQLRGSF
ncbi:MAG: tetratricopeptide repeat protein [Sandaracinaceae bacterium]|nr:tetratricopeptide repeat protein [Sandaracinaceae bacterium]